MCTSSCHTLPPNSAANGRTFSIWPLTTSYPPGSFIQPFTAITSIDPVTPAMATGMPTRKCVRGGSLSQPYT